MFGVGKKGKFYITNGSNISVDKYMRDAFTCFLNKTGIARVYFTGRKTSGKIWEGISPENNFKGAELSLFEGGGIHCRTLTVPISSNGLDLGIKNEKESLFQTNTSVVESLPLFCSDMLHLIENDNHQI